MWDAWDGTDASMDWENETSEAEYCPWAIAGVNLGHIEGDAIEDKGGTHPEASVNPITGEAFMSGICLKFCIVNGDDTINVDRKGIGFCRAWKILISFSFHLADGMVWNGMNKHLSLAILRLIRMR